MQHSQENTCAEWCALQLYCTSLIYIYTFKIKSNWKHFKSSRMAPKHQNLYFLLNIHLWKKTKTCLEWPNLVSGCLIQVFYKTTTFPRRPLFGGPKSGCLIPVLVNELPIFWEVSSATDPSTTVFYSWIFQLMFFFN